MSKYRKSMSGKSSRKNFTRNAYPHPKNTLPTNARGGRRL